MHVNVHINHPIVALFLRCSRARPASPQRASASSQRCSSGALRRQPRLIGGLKVVLICFHGVMVKFIMNIMNMMNMMNNECDECEE